MQAVKSKGETQRMIERIKDGKRRRWKEKRIENNENDKLDFDDDVFISINSVCLWFI